MSERRCLGCGAKEERHADRVNLDPTTQLCVECLIQSALESKGLKRGRPEPQETAFDARAKAARNDD